MLAAVGNKVVNLHRTQIGQLGLEQLAEGEWVYLTTEQILAAKNLLDVELVTI